MIHQNNQGWIKQLREKEDRPHKPEGNTSMYLTFGWKLYQ